MRCSCADAANLAAGACLSFFLLCGSHALAFPAIPQDASPRFLSWPGQTSCLAIRNVDAGGGIWTLGDASSQVFTGRVRDAVLGPGSRFLLLDAAGTVRRLRRPGDEPEPVDGWTRPADPAREGATRLAVMPDGVAWRDGADDCLGPDHRRIPAPGEASGRRMPLAADPFGNLWSARAGEADGNASVAVLPYGNRTNWAPVGGCPIRPDARAVWLVADEVGGIWVSDGASLFRTDPRAERLDWTRADAGLPAGGITALDVAADGAALVGFSSGEVGVCDSTRAGSIAYRRLVEGRGVAVRALHADDAGNTWMVRGTTLERVGPPKDVRQRRWRNAGRLPCGNHDLSTTVLDDVCYLAGGLALSCGIPAEKRILDSVLAYDASRCLWAERARLSPGRAGVGLAALDGKLWMVNGHIATPKGLRATRSVDRFDPVRGVLERGPETRQARLMTIAAVVGGRVYVVDGGSHGKPVRAALESIGPGDREWRVDGESPYDLEAGVGCAYRGRLFVQVQRNGLVSYDPAARAWRTDHARPPREFRSSQVAVHAGRLWFVGGRGTPTETETFSYDGATDTWRAEAPAPRPCAWGAAASLNGRLYIHGGAIGRCCSDRTFVLNEEPERKK